MPDLEVRPTPIPGLMVVRLPVHGDNRGWFKENWQREKMVALGLPDFGPVQNNVSFNPKRGTTRGIHAEPWDKFVSVAAGRFFGAWVDLREGPAFGTVFTAEVGPETAVFVPRGVGNSYQTLEDDTAYTYLVNDHWSPAAREQYTYLNLADATSAVPWPIPLAEAELSAADRAHPMLEDVRPFPAARPLVLGAGGQLGRALARALPDAVLVGRDRLDLADPQALASWDWAAHDVVVNAAAFTAVDAAETAEGRAAAWAVNARAVAQLADLARRHRFTLVHVSTDYVFDGSREVHDEAEPFAPLNTYGASKAAGDLAVAGVPRHYVVRTSWVVGDGGNFVRTMARLADEGVSPSVVDDQFGRLTFTDDLSAAIAHLVRTMAPFGTYNVTSSGPTLSWCDIARDVFALRGRDPDDVTGLPAAEYAAGRTPAVRPRHSTLDLAKLEATGFRPRAGREALEDYLSGVPAGS